MGYEDPSEAFRLEFEDRDGLEVLAGSISMGRVLELTEQADTLRAGNGNSLSARELFEEFAGALRSWNVTKGGEDVAPDLTGLLSLSPRLAMTILLAWFDAMVGGDLEAGPLDRRSANGKPSGPAPFVPTEVL